MPVVFAIARQRRLRRGVAADSALRETQPDCNLHQNLEATGSLRLGQDNDPTTIWQFSTVGFAAGTPQRCDAQSTWNVGMAEGGFERRDSAFAITASWRFAFNRSTALLKSTVRMTAPNFMHRSRMSSRSAMHTDLRLAHSLLM